MMLASFLIVILGISIATGDRASHHVEAISIVGAVALLVTYLVWIVDYLRSDDARASRRTASRRRDDASRSCCSGSPASAPRSSRTGS